MRVCLCVLPLNLRYKKNCSPDKLLTNGTGCERSELKRFSCRNVVLLRRYGSFNGLIVLCHLELLTSAERSHVYQVLLRPQHTFCVEVHQYEDGRNSPQMTILGGDAI